MDGDPPTMSSDFLQDLDLWLLQGGAASPAMHRLSQDAAAVNAGVSSLDASLFAPLEPPTGPDKTDSTGSFVATLTDDSLPWTALTAASPMASGSVSLPPPVPRPRTPQGAVKATETKAVKPRKGRPPAASKTGSEPPKKKGNTNKSTSQRQKEELAYLREKSEQLELDLESLKQQNRAELERQQREQELHELQAGETSTCMVSFEQPAQPEVSLWERIAKRQREEKAKAEVENVKLREMVQSQVRLVKSFERLLRKRRVWDQLQESSKQERADSRNEEETLEDMLRDVDARYPRVDAVLKEHGLGEDDPAVDVGDDASMKYSPVDGMYLEYREKKFMPFEYKALDVVVWRAFGDGKLKLEETQLTVIKHTEDVTISKAILPLARKGSGASKDMGSSVILSVMKRFSEENRVVFVWCTNTSAKRAEDGSMSPVLLAQKGYAVMEAATLPDGSPGCVSRSYTNSVPTLATQPAEGSFEQQQERYREVGVLTELVFAAYQHSRQTINQILENLVLDEMMAKSSASTPAASATDTDASF